MSAWYNTSQKSYMHACILNNASLLFDWNFLTTEISQHLIPSISASTTASISVYHTLQHDTTNNAVLDLHIHVDVMSTWTYKRCTQHELCWWVTLLPNVSEQDVPYNWWSTNCSKRSEKKNVIFRVSNKVTRWA